MSQFCVSSVAEAKIKCVHSTMKGASLNSLWAYSKLLLKNAFNETSEVGRIVTITLKGEQNIFY